VERVARCACGAGRDRRGHTLGTDVGRWLPDPGVEDEIEDITPPMMRVLGASSPFEIEGDPISAICSVRNPEELRHARASKSFRRSPCAQ
jgi:hypothetical protein